MLNKEIVKARLRQVKLYPLARHWYRRLSPALQRHFLTGMESTGASNLVVMMAE